MKNNSKFEWLQILVSIGVLLTSIVAIKISMNIENRNSERFDKQLSESDRIAQATIKPLLSIFSEVYQNKKSIILSNEGLGTAKLLNYSMSKGGLMSENITDLMDFNQNFKWDYFHRFGNITFIRAGEKIVLASISHSNLINQNISPDEAYRILESFDIQRKKIDLYFEYEDILGNKQAPLVW